MKSELPNDDSRAKGAGWVHGAASEVDLGSKCGFRPGRAVSALLALWLKSLRLSLGIGGRRVLLCIPCSLCLLPR